MNRFLLSREAEQDIDELDVYLNRVPGGRAATIVAKVHHTLQDIASHPYLGVGHSELTRAFGEEIRSRITVPYRIYYRLGKRYPEILAVLHGSRDQRAEMLRRVQ